MAEITAPPVSIGRLITAHGTITADTKTLESTVTWNSGATTFTAWKLNVTNTASNAASKLIDLQTGGVTQFNVTRAGVVTAATSFVATTLTGTLSTAAQPNVTSLGTLTSITTSGVFTGSNGSVGTPAINVGDAATGFYRAAENYVRVSNNGAATFSFEPAAVFAMAAFTAQSTLDVLGATTTVALTASGLVTANGGLSVLGGNSTAQGVLVQGALMAGTTQYGINCDVTDWSDGTTLGAAIRARIQTRAAAFTVTSAAGIYISDAVKGAGSTITTQYGLYIEAPTQGATNYGLYVAGGGAVITGALSGVTTLSMSGNLTLSGYGSGGGLVSVGAADSGGAGFKLLRVPN